MTVMTHLANLSKRLTKAYRQHSSAVCAQSGSDTHENLKRGHSTGSDSLEKIAFDMYQEIIEHDEKHPDEIPPSSDARRMYGDRLRKLGVVL